MGTPEHKSEYLYTANSDRVYENHEKEQKHREYWNRMYEEKQEDGDDETNTTVRRYLEQYILRTYPHELSDNTGLHNDNYLTRPISNEDIIHIIRSMKKTCPGSCRINKIIYANYLLTVYPH